MSVGVVLVALAAGCSDDAEPEVNATSTGAASSEPPPINSEVLVPSTGSTTMTTQPIPASTAAAASPTSELDAAAMLAGLRRLLENPPAAQSPGEIEYDACAIGDLRELASVLAEVVPAVSVDGLRYQRRESDDAGLGRVECAGFAGSSENSPGVQIDVIAEFHRDPA
jgi:hypothetical protein